MPSLCQNFVVICSDHVHPSRYIAKIFYNLDMQLQKAIIYQNWDLNKAITFQDATFFIISFTYLKYIYRLKMAIEYFAGQLQDTRLAAEYSLVTLNLYIYFGYYEKQCFLKLQGTLIKKNAINSVVGCDRNVDYSKMDYQQKY